MTQQKLSAERARELFSYDPETGSLVWKVNKYRVRAGDEAGCTQPNGYLKMTVDQQNYWGHRVAWLIVTGDWPLQSLDHINGDPSDNRWANLRDVSHGTNMENRTRPNKNSPTGYLGVRACGARFRAVIVVSRVSQSLGVYPTPKEAHQAYVTAKRQLHAGCTI